MSISNVKISQIVLPFFQRIFVLIFGLSEVRASLCCCTICEYGSHARKPVFWDFWNTRKQLQVHLRPGSYLDECRLSNLKNFYIFTWEHTFLDRAEHHHRSPLSHTAPSCTSGSSSCLRTSQKTSDTPEISGTNGLITKSPSLRVIPIRCY